MPMNIIYAPPPNFAAICKVMPRANTPGEIAFTYGSTIYWPGGETQPPLHFAIMAHEEIHCIRQGDDPAGWWDRYLKDPQFRFDEELLAHRKEYETATKGRDRNFRRRVLTEIGQRLAGPLYGRLMAESRVRRLIKMAEEDCYPPNPFAKTSPTVDNLAP